jgi:hypothetical protein
MPMNSLNPCSLSTLSVMSIKPIRLVLLQVVCSLLEEQIQVCAMALSSTWTWLVHHCTGCSLLAVSTVILPCYWCADWNSQQSLYKARQSPLTHLVVLLPSTQTLPLSEHPHPLPWVFWPKFLAPLSLLEIGKAYMHSVSICTLQNKLCETILQEGNWPYNL